MRSQRIGRGFESLYLHHAKRQAFACLFAWWSLNGEYAAQPQNEVCCKTESAVVRIRDSEF